MTLKLYQYQESIISKMNNYFFNNFLLFNNKSS